MFLEFLKFCTSPSACFTGTQGLSFASVGEVFATSSIVFCGPVSSLNTCVVLQEQEPWR